MYFMKVRYVSSLGEHNREIISIDMICSSCVDSFHFGRVSGDEIELQISRLNYENEFNGEIYDRVSGMFDLENEI